MGVPAFFRWLSKKYPSIVVECEDHVKGTYPFDNLYLDMNGIIHPCSHPEYKAAPETEEEMFLAIFEYVENIMKIVKPKNLLYMAVDGCAPRAKMNQQRSRRFRASQESVEKLLEIQKIKEELRGKGIEVKDKPKEAHFDSNVITPGTQFMINLSEALRTWIDQKLSNDNEDKDGIWPKDMMVILSDASVPGEGEHKIMEYIRKQKAQSATYNPNLSHCLYGADADLIMLGLATHELNFTILREEFKPNQPKPCDICGQLGHAMEECLGTERPPEDMDTIMPTEPDFIYIRLPTLREYLQKECSNSAVHLDFERFIDDFVFLCFFVGNDFLPHLPSLEIRENAIDRLIHIYKDVARKFPDPQNSPYLTKDGIVNFDRVQYVLQELGEAEDEIFIRRQENEMRFRERRKREKRQKLEQQNIDSVWLRPEAISRGMRPTVFDDTRGEAYNLRVAANNVDNMSAAQKLKSMLKDFGTDDKSKGSDTQSQQTGVETPQPQASGPQTQTQTQAKRKRDGNDSDEEPEDLVQLYNEGWKERYYNHKFDCTSTSISVISGMVVDEYVRGCQWVLLYYYQGCPDWKWFYPFHYAPFASDFKNIADVTINFDKNAQPFNPLEQLMAVFPAASSQNLPPSWRQMMSDPKSSIIDFYPNTFKIDLNGKKAAWMGVALLPFIDENRLFNALKKVYGDLTEEERSRNQRGTHLIFISRMESDFSDFSKEVVETPVSCDVNINPEIFRGIAGTIAKSEKFSDRYKRVYCAVYKDPVYEPDFIFPAIRLPNAKQPPIVLKPEDLDKLDRYRWQPRIGFGGGPRFQKASLSEGGMRMFEHHMPRDSEPYHRRNFNRDRDGNTGQYQNPYNRQYISRDHTPAQQYNSFYRPPNPYNPNMNSYVSTQNDYRTDQSGQQSSRDSFFYREQNNRNSDRRQNYQRNSYDNSYQNNAYGQRQSYPNQGYDRNPRQQYPQQGYQSQQRNQGYGNRQHQQQQQSQQQQPYYGSSAGNQNRRNDPWNRSY